MKINNVIGHVIISLKMGPLFEISLATGPSAQLPLISLRRGSLRSWPQAGAQWSTPGTFPFPRLTIGLWFLCARLFIFQSEALSEDFWGKLVALGSFEASQVGGFVP